MSKAKEGLKIVREKMFELKNKWIKSEINEYLKSIKNQNSLIDTYICSLKKFGTFEKKITRKYINDFEKMVRYLN